VKRLARLLALVWLLAALSLVGWLIVNLDTAGWILVALTGGLMVFELTRRPARGGRSATPAKAPQRPGEPSR
jgi:hypothetical protein